MSIASAYARQQTDGYSPQRVGQSLVSRVKRRVGSAGPCELVAIRFCTAVTVGIVASSCGGVSRKNRAPGIAELTLAWATDCRQRTRRQWLEVFSVAVARPSDDDAHRPQQALCINNSVPVCADVLGGCHRFSLLLMTKSCPAAADLTRC